MACVTPMKALRLRLLLWPLSYATLCAVRDRVQGKALAGDRAMALALPAVSRLVEEVGRACGPLPGDAPMFRSVRTLRCGRSEAEDIIDIAAGFPGAPPSLDWTGDRAAVRKEAAR